MERPLYCGCGDTAVGCVTATRTLLAPALRGGHSTHHTTLNSVLHISPMKVWFWGEVTRPLLYLDGGSIQDGFMDGNKYRSVQELRSYSTLLRYF